VLVLYISILIVGFVIIAVILLKEKKGQQPSPADLLKNLDLESEETNKPAYHTSFLKRLHLENDKPHPSVEAEPLEAKQAAEELKNKKIETKTTENMNAQVSLPHSPHEQLTDINELLKNSESQSQKYKSDLDISIKEIKKARDYIAELQKTIDDKDKEIENLTFELSEKKYNTRLAQEQEKSQSLENDGNAPQPTDNNQDTANIKDDSTQSPGPQSQESRIENPPEKEKQPLAQNSYHIQKIFIDLPDSKKIVNDVSAANVLDLNKADDDVKQDNPEKKDPNKEDQTLPRPSDINDQMDTPPPDEPSAKEDSKHTTDEP
jgi:hypothetical protein